MQIASAASRVNAQRTRMLTKIREALNGLKGKMIGMLTLVRAEYE